METLELTEMVEQREQQEKISYMLIPGLPIIRTHTIESIWKFICKHYVIPEEAFQSKTRKREIVQARQISMYFSKRLTKSSLAEIGLQIGDKDHATVIYACKNINNLIDTDKKFKLQIEDIEKKLK